MTTSNMKPAVARTVSAHILSEVSDPDSPVVALKKRSRPKLRRLANGLGARDLALMPAVTRDAPAVRLIQSRPALRRRNARKTPFVTYISTVIAALAVGSLVGLGIVNGNFVINGSPAQILTHR